MERAWFLETTCASHADQRPTLADLRESGDLDNAADSVLGLYRDELEHADSPLSCDHHPVGSS